YGKENDRYIPGRHNWVRCWYPERLAAF
ncbi:hypothetical protein LCGC14_2740860, partial [marine sediment metagenome]